MTKKQLIELLETVDDDSIVICKDESGGWDNVQDVKDVGGIVEIIFGGGSPFTDE